MLWGRIINYLVKINVINNTLGPTGKLILFEQTKKMGEGFKAKVQKPRRLSLFGRNDAHDFFREPWGRLLSFDHGLKAIGIGLVSQLFNIFACHYDFAPRLRPGLVVLISSDRLMPLKSWAIFT